MKLQKYSANAGMFSFVLLVFLTPVYIYVDLLVRLFLYALIITSVFVALIPIKNATYLQIVITVSIFVYFIILGDPLKGIGASLIFYTAYNGIRQSVPVVLHAHLALLVINYLLVAIQLSGATEFAYWFVDYRNDAVQTSMFDVKSVAAEFLPQMRPSGVFPAPTYISIFCIVLFSLTIFISKKIRGATMVMMGSFFMLTGSTLGLVLALLLLVVSCFDRGIVFVPLGYAVTYCVYAVLVPEIAAYNFNMLDFDRSIFSRPMHESIIEKNIILFICIVMLLALAGLWFKFKTFCASIAVPVILILSTIVLHDISESLIYYLILGMGVGMLGGSRYMISWKGGNAYGRNSHP